MSPQPTNTNESHFVASLKIERVNRQTGMPGNVNEKRDVAEVTHMTIKSSSLSQLKQKLASHIALVEDD